MGKFKPEQAPKQKTFVSASETNRLTKSSAADNNTPVASSFSASRIPEMQASASPAQAGIMPAELENSKILQIPPRPAGKLPQKISRKQNSLNKKLLAIADDAKPTHKLANWGFALGLSGIVLALIGLLTVTTIPLLLAFLMSIPGLIVSRKGLAKIKQQPEQYGGKGLAVGGLVMSGLMLILFAALIFLLLAFAGAFA